MGRKRVTCVVLECDRCGVLLEGDEPFARHYQQNQVRLMEAEAEKFGWSTDGRGRWHCGCCPPLEDEHATAKVALIPGQAELDEELGRGRPGTAPEESRPSPVDALRRRRPRDVRA